LSHKFVRSGFELAKSDHVELDEVPACEVSIRCTLKISSQHGGQGFEHCNCNSGCNGSRCIVKKKEDYATVDVTKVYLAQINNYF
jgi:hypothetical protein